MSNCIDDSVSLRWLVLVLWGMAPRQSAKDIQGSHVVDQQRSAAIRILGFETGGECYGSYGQLPASLILFVFWYQWDSH